MRHFENNKNLLEQSPQELKAGGIIPQRQKGKVTVRCMSPGGRLSAGQLRKIAEVAEKYGTGRVHLSVRMSPEILDISLEQVLLVKAELAQADVAIASCGKRVRVPTACGGCDYNPNGLIDTYRLAVDFNGRYFGQSHWHKFKTAFSGCPIDCMRTRESDLGFQGQVEPRLLEDLCTGCQLCVEICQERALEMEEDLPVRDSGRCSGCADCIKVCPTDAWIAGRVGAAVYVGGKHGRHPRAAYPVAQFVPLEKIFPVSEAVMSWYREKGRPEERIGATISRVGINDLRQTLIPIAGDNLLQPSHLQEHRWKSAFWAGTVEVLTPYQEL